MANVKKYKITEPYLDISCSLGEAPFWEQASNTLRFVDIMKHKLHTIDLSKGPSSHKQWDLDFSIGTTADIEGNDQEFIFGGKSGYGLFNRITGEHRTINSMWNDDERKDDGGGKPGAGKNREERMRSNDGAVDKAGRYWVGTMNDPELVGTNFTDEGVLFRLDPDLSLHRIREGVTIPNGISWTLDNKTVYFTDTITGKIVTYPFDLNAGTIDFSQGKTFFTCPIEGGAPDGHCQDEEGCLWIACYHTGKVFRVDPQGQIIAEVELPTRCVTCPGICGTELFITSAEEPEPEKYPESAKYQGRLFKIDIGIRGAPLNKFRMTAKA